MGRAKDMWMEAQERGWSSISKFVCADCVEDIFLADLIQDNLEADSCDYCGAVSSDNIAAPVDAVLDVVFNTIHTYFAEPTEAGVPYDKGFVLEPVYTGDVLQSIAFDGHPDLYDDVCSASMNDAWVPAAQGHWLGNHEHQELLWGWDRFSNLVKHATRYHFSNTPPLDELDPGEVDPRFMLRLIGTHLQTMVTTIPKGTIVYRCRRRKRNDAWSPIAEELGAPKPEKARAGRMNPAGIPYLYTAFDAETVLHEVGAHKRTTDTIVIAHFILNTDVDVVDLTRLPPEPSIFDLERKAERERTLFVQGFANEITKPVTKDGQEHIDYVPSQVVCEYLAQIFKLPTGKPLSGLIYPSSALEGGRNLVIFPSSRGLDDTKFSCVTFVDPFRYQKAPGANDHRELSPYPAGRLIPI